MGGNAGQEVASYFCFIVFQKSPLFGLDKQCRTGAIKDEAELTASANPYGFILIQQKPLRNTPDRPPPCLIDSRMGSWVWAELMGDEAE